MALKALPPKSEPIGHKKATKRVAAIPPSGMKVRACNGPYRNSWFRFYPSNDRKPSPLWPFGGKYKDKMVLTDRGMMQVYHLVQSDDPTAWGLYYDPIGSVLEES